MILCLKLRILRCRRDPSASCSETLEQDLNTLVFFIWDDACNKAPRPLSGPLLQSVPFLHLRRIGKSNVQCVTVEKALKGGNYTLSHSCFEGRQWRRPTDRNLHRIPLHGEGCADRQPRQEVRVWCPIWTFFGSCARTKNGICTRCHAVVWAGPHRASTSLGEVAKGGSVATAMDWQAFTAESIEDEE